MKGNPLDRRKRDNLETDLSAHLDGELSAERAREVEQFLAESDDARRTLDDLRDIADLLATLPRRSAPDALAAAMSRHAERRPLFDDRQAARRSRVIKLFARLSAAAAVIAAGVFVGYQVLQPTSPTGLDLAEAPSAPRPESEFRALVTAENSEEGAEIEAEAVIARADLKDLAGPAVVDFRKSKAPVHALRRELDVGRGPTAEDSTGDMYLHYGPAADEAKAKQATAADKYTYHIALGEHDGPLVSIVITPRSKVEYAATKQLLARWTAPHLGLFVDELADKRGSTRRRGDTDGGERSRMLAGGAADFEPPPIAGRQAVEHVYQIQATELNRRIDQLAAQAPNQFRVRMSFMGGSSILGEEPVATGIPAARAKKSSAVGGSPASAAPPAGKGGESKEDALARDEARGKGAPDDAERAQRPARGRHGGRGQPPTGARGTRPAGAQRESINATRRPPSRPARSAEKLGEWSLSPELTKRLFGLLFAGSPAGAWPTFDQPGGPATQPVDTAITFRVLLLPPASSR